MEKVIFHDIRNCSQRKEFAPSGSKFFPLREAPIFKKGAIRIIFDYSNACKRHIGQFMFFVFFSRIRAAITQTASVQYHQSHRCPHDK